MTVAVDANVFLDVLSRDPQHYMASQRAIRDATRAGDVIVCEAVFAELSPRLADHGGIGAFLNDLEVAFEPSRPEALHLAGTAFQAYLQQRRGFRCAECGRPVEARCPSCGALVTRRQHVLADFMIGAHAQVHAGRLLTRDRGYYRTYFPDLVIV